MVTKGQSEPCLSAKAIELMCWRFRCLLLVIYPHLKDVGMFA
jgi:hypothetical protein